MSRSLDDLTPEFHLKVVALLQDVATRGFDLEPYFTLRDPQTQAELWRQSRNVAEITAEVARLQSIGAPWLASVLRDAPARSGPWATNASPGNSWHQFGEACDCYWKTATGVQWNDGAGYVMYANQATVAGLTPGRDFTRPDIDHVQLRSEGAPSDLYSWSDIDKQMKERFGQ